MLIDNSGITGISKITESVLKILMRKRDSLQHVLDIY